MEEDLVCYGDKAITELSTFLKSLLEQNKCNVENIPAQWDTLKNRVKHTVSGLKDVNYLEVWAKLLTNKSVKEDCSDVLHVIELFLITPVTNAKVERMFSRMNRVKTDWRSSLKRERLDHLLRIGEEGVLLTEFNPESAIDVWNRETVRRIAAAKPHRYPKKLKAHLHAKLLMFHSIRFQTWRLTKVTAIQKLEDTLFIHFLLRLLIVL